VRIITNKQRLEQAKMMRDDWIKAEAQVMAGQSYSIDGKTVTKANLSEIRNSVKFWENKVSMLNRKLKGKGSIRIKNVVPMD